MNDNDGEIQVTSRDKQPTWAGEQGTPKPLQTRDLFRPPKTLCHGLML